MIRPIRYLLVASLAAGLVTAGLLWWQSDDPLDPRAQAWLDAAAPGPLDPDDGYVLLMGLAASEGEDAAARGLAHLERLRARVAEPSSTASVGVGLGGVRDYPKPEGPLLCHPSEEGCLDRILSPEAERAELLVTHATLLARYRRLLAFERLSTLTAPAADEELPPLDYLTSAAHLQRLAIVEALLEGRAGEAIAILRDDLAGLRRHLALADHLVHKMALVRLLEEQTHLLGALRERGLWPVPAGPAPGSDTEPGVEPGPAPAAAPAPEPHPDLGPALAPLTPAERDLTPALRREFAIQAQLIRSLGEDPAPLDGIDWAPPWVLRSFFKPNMCLNGSYEMFRRDAELSRLEATEYAATVQVERPLPEFGGVRNTVCRILVTTAAPDFRRYIARVHGLEDRLADLREL
jgi:hypothetical protein